MATEGISTNSTMINFVLKATAKVQTIAPHYMYAYMVGYLVEVFSSAYMCAQPWYTQTSVIKITLEERSHKKTKTSTCQRHFHTVKFVFKEHAE